MNLSKIKTADFMTTGSVPQPGGADREAFSDESTIRNAVSSANLEQLGAAPLHWENKDTGSRGTVTGIEEYEEKSNICRKFTATRESFEGVAAYEGSICLGEGGYWWIKDFEAV
jgi:surface antigen